MARPRVITLEKGEVSLQGFPKEVADALTEHLNNFGKQTISLPESSVEHKLEPTQTQQDLPSRAIGVHVNGRQHSLVTVAYDAETKQAKVIEVLKCFDSRECRMEFKKAADRNKFV